MIEAVCRVHVFRSDGVLPLQLFVARMKLSISGHLQPSENDTATLRGTFPQATVPASVEKSNSQLSRKIFSSMRVRSCLRQAVGFFLASSSQL